MVAFRIAVLLILGLAMATGCNDGIETEDLGTPLLDRPGVLVYDCRVTRPMEKCDFTNHGGFELVGSEDAVYLSSVRSQVDDVIVDTLPVVRDTIDVLWSTIGFDGVIGPEASVAQTVTNTDNVVLTGSAASGDRFTLLWYQSSNGSPTDTDSSSMKDELWIAQIDETGSVITEPRKFVDNIGNQYDGEIVASNSGYFAAWSDEETQREKPISRLWSALLDETGQIVGTPHNLVGNGTTDVGIMDLVPTDNGFAMTYSYSGSDYKNRNYYQAFDTLGNPRGEPYSLNKSGFIKASIITRGAETVVAWTKWEGDSDKEQALIHLRRFDEEGRPVGAKFALQKPVEDEQNVYPRLFNVGDDIGLIWGHGRITYVCGGCMPDDVLHLVILDGNDLSPRSEVITLVNPETSGGLTHPKVVVSGDEILVVSDITYHAYSEAASGTIRCTRSLKPAVE